MTPAEFAVAANVSRETLDRFKAYASLLQKFQRALNLVGPNTLLDPWRRHFLDSAQLFPLLPTDTTQGNGGPVILDLGSGAGFPGLVLALMGEGAGTPLRVHLVESDGRKATFLKEVARRIGCSVTVHNLRIEAMEPFPVDVICARAFAPIARILRVSEHFLTLPEARPMVLLLKGRRATEELTDAKKGWKMQVESISSITGADAMVLRLRDIARE
jgi:16S rRNA (guanine527-N7)-methyltransferase